MVNNMVNSNILILQYKKITTAYYRQATCTRVPFPQHEGYQ